MFFSSSVRLIISRLAASNICVCDHKFAGSHLQILREIINKIYITSELPLGNIRMWNKGIAFIYKDFTLLVLWVEKLHIKIFLH